MPFPYFPAWIGVAPIWTSIVALSESTYRFLSSLTMDIHTLQEFPGRRRSRRRPVSRPQTLPPLAPKPMTPLALDVDEGSCLPQETSPLFAVIPKEMRDLIFEHALTAYPDPKRPYGPNESYARPGVVGHLRVATELLQTCKSIYLETYQLPITLNPVILYRDSPANVPPHAQNGERQLRKLAPWQWAALCGADLSLQQVHLEQRAIADMALQLLAKRRYAGDRCLRNPIYEQSIMGVTDWMASYGRPPNASEGAIVERLSGLRMPSKDPTIPRCIERLTLRMGRTEWWTWASAPNSAEQLGIDPGYGGGNDFARCTTEKMLEEAEKRRRGQWTGWPRPSCWGAQISDFQGLRCLELVFETFAVKKGQLETVIECAKTWTFPMEEASELRWDGEVIDSSWQGIDEGYGYESDNSWLTVQTAVSPRLFEVRTIRFTKRAVR